MRLKQLLAPSMLIVVAIFAGLIISGDIRAGTSDLWGQDGEVWTPRSRLPDFAFAGYAMGKSAPPALPVRVNVRDFGAKGDGVVDDSDAFVNAISAVDSGAVLIPAGRYKITKRLVIDRSRIVLRGAGKGKTVLFAPAGLYEIDGQGHCGPKGRRGWAWCGGLIWIEGRKALATVRHSVVAPAARGDFILSISSSAGLDVGQTVAVFQKDSGDGSLPRHLHNDELDAHPIFNGVELCLLVAEIVAIDDNDITLNRPLRTDLRLAWRPEIRDYNPTVTDVGVEALTIEFADRRYEGHYNGYGSNGIFFKGVANSWCRNVEIRNADNGIFFHSTNFCMAEGVDLTVSDAGRREIEVQGDLVTGHHGIEVSHSHDTLIAGFKLETRFAHDLTVQHFCTGNVFANGSGPDINLDHHTMGPFENLFTCIDAGEGTRLWKSSGGRPPCSGARETFWNIRTKRKQGYPKFKKRRRQKFAPKQLNVIGIHSLSRPLKGGMQDRWLEPIPPEALIPQNLHEAQRMRHGYAAGGHRRGAYITPPGSR